MNPSKDAFIDWIGHRKIEGRCLLSRWESNSSLKETNMSMTKETTLGCRFVVVWITVRKLPIIRLLWWRRSPWCGQPITVVWFLWLFFVFFFVKVQQILLLFSLISWFSNPLSHFSLLPHRRIFSPVNGPTFFSHDWVSSWWFLHPSNYFQHFYQIFDHFNRLIWFLGKQLIWELVQARFSIKLFRKLNSSILNNSTNQLVLEELKQ